MRGNINKVRGPMPWLRSGGSRETYVTTSVWFGKTPSARDKATIDQLEVIPEYSIASDDQLLVEAQFGDQQAFVELCRRHGEERIFSIVRNQEDAEDALQDTPFESLQTHGHISTQLHILYMAHEYRDEHGIDDPAQEEDAQGRKHRCLERRKQGMGSDGVCGPFVKSRKTLFKTSNHPCDEARDQEAATDPSFDD
jgi:hypothetical protein